MNPSLQIGISPTLQIRGVLAIKDIKKDEIVERCPVILIDIKDFDHLKKTALKNYYFDWNKNYVCIILGYGSIYNHSYSPNAKYTFDHRRKYVIFKAIKDIKKGEEIFVNYNYYPTSKAKLEEGLLSKDKRYNSS